MMYIKNMGDLCAQCVKCGDNVFTK